jgi:hypothetical protein
MAWTTREAEGPLAPTALKARVRYLASPPAPPPFSNCPCIVLYSLKEKSFN